MKFLFRVLAAIEGAVEVFGVQIGISVALVVGYVLVAMLLNCPTCCNIC